MVLIRNDPAPCSRGYLALMFWVGPAQTVPQVRTCSPTCTLCLPGNASALPTDRSLINLLCSGSCSCCRRTLVPGSGSSSCCSRTLVPGSGSGTAGSGSISSHNQAAEHRRPGQKKFYSGQSEELYTSTSPEFSSPPSNQTADYRNKPRPLTTF